MLRSVDEIVDALGGSTAVAGLTGVTVPAVSNWRFRRAIPAENFMALSAALARLEKEADPAVFGFKPIAEAGA